MSQLHPIDGKYFLVLSKDRDGARVWRGRLRGIVNDLLPTIYLVDIYALDLAASPEIQSQTLITLEQLLEGWLYDDRAIWEFETIQLIERMDRAKAKASKIIQAHARAQRKLVQELTKSGAPVTVITDAGQAGMGVADALAADETEQDEG